MHFFPLNNESRGKRNDRDGKARKMQHRVSRSANYNCKHRLLVSAACTISSVLSLRKFSHFNQCYLSVSPCSFLLDFCVHLLLVTLGRFEVPRHGRLRFPWDSYSTEYVMGNRLRWDGNAKERKRVLPIRDVCVQMSPRSLVYEKYACSITRRALQE